MSTPVHARSDNNNAKLVSTCPRRLLESGNATTSGSACHGTESWDGDAEEYNVLQLECLCTVEAPKFLELHFCYGYALDDNKKKILIVTQRQLANHPPFGYVSMQSTNNAPSRWKIRGAYFDAKYRKWRFPK